MGQRHTRSHLQQETQGDSGGQKEKGSYSRQHRIPTLFISKVGALNPISVGGSSTEAMQSQGLHHEVREHCSVAAFWMATVLLSSLMEKVSINKRIVFILQCSALTSCCGDEQSLCNLSGAHRCSWSAAR